MATTTFFRFRAQAYWIRVIENEQMAKVPRENYARRYAHMYGEYVCIHISVYIYIYMYISFYMSFVLCLSLSLSLSMDTCGLPMLERHLVFGGTQLLATLTSASILGIRQRYCSQTQTQNPKLNPDPEP